MNNATIKFQDPNSNFVAYVEVRNAVGYDILKMCKTMDDVQRCAEMGDFRIAGYDLPEAA